MPAISPSSAAAAPVAPLPVAPAPAGASRTSRASCCAASADAWVQVRDRAGPVLLNRILHAGETWDVPAKPNLLLTTGNAGGTDLRGGWRDQPVARRRTAWCGATCRWIPT